MDLSPAANLNTIVTLDQYEKVKTWLLQKLENDLPPHFTYHNVAHTRSVISATDYLARREGVPENDRLLLLTAALIHDSGFLRNYDNHEEISCEIAEEILPGYGYCPESIIAICRLIRATKIPQEPTNLYENILCDADLFYLGKAEFSFLSECLYKELKAVGQIQSDEEWQAKQDYFLEKHYYFTATARTELEPKKKAQIRQLREKRPRSKWSGYFNYVPTQNVKDYILMFLGVWVAGFALKSFLVPHHFFDGGVTGISLLLHELYGYNLALTIVLANLPLIVVSFFTVNRRFAFKMLLCVVLYGICLAVFPYPPIPEGERILLAIFGGFFLGVGIGLCMRAGCALDGVEVLALKTFKRTPFTITEIILAINILIFCVAAFELGPMTALYSVVTYFTASKTIDYVIEGIEAYTGVTIISAESELIKYRLVNELGRGITVYRGERGFLPGRFETSADCDIIFTVVTRLELRRLKNVVHETDPEAFVFANTIREATGGILRRRQSH